VLSRSPKQTVSLMSWWKDFGFIAQLLSLKIELSLY
jgi:hypothetical protein